MVSPGLTTGYLGLPDCLAGQSDHWSKCTQCFSQREARETHRMPMYAYEHTERAHLHVVDCLHTPLRVRVHACVGFPMSSTKCLTSLDHRCTPAPTMVVLFYHCLFGSDRGQRALKSGGPVRCNNAVGGHGGAGGVPAGGASGQRNRGAATGARYSPRFPL